MQEQFQIFSSLLFEVNSFWPDKQWEKGEEWDWTVNSSPIYIYKKKIKQNKNIQAEQKEKRHIKNRPRVFFPSLNYLCSIFIHVHCY